MIRIFGSEVTAKTLAAAISLASASAASAHHSFAMYDNDKEVTLDGVVRVFQWANPHGSIALMIMQDGKPAEYPVELSSLNVMSRQGWTRNSLQPGEHVKITVHPLKDGTQGGSFVKAVRADGSVLMSAAPR